MKAWQDSGVVKFKVREETAMQTFTARLKFQCPNCNRPVHIDDSIRWFDFEEGTYQHDECPSAHESRKQTAKQQAYLFFLRHAGYSYDPKTQTKQQGRAACARRLAKAERDARALGYTFEWSDDWTLGCSHFEFYGESYDHGEPKTCESCLMRDSNGKIVQSLGCIDDATREYRRVVEAELALEEVS